MQREPRAYLYDIAQAAALIADFTAGVGLDAYLDRAMVRAAVERRSRSSARRSASSRRSIRRWPRGSPTTAA